MPVVLLIELAMITFSLLKGWSAQKFEGYVFIAANWRKITKYRAFVQSKRIVDDKAIVDKYESQLSFSEFNILPVRLVVNPLLKAYWYLVKPLI